MSRMLAFKIGLTIYTLVLAVALAFYMEPLINDVPYSCMDGTTSICVERLHGSD